MAFRFELDPKLPIQVRGDAFRLGQVLSRPEEKSTIPTQSTELLQELSILLVEDNETNMEKEDLYKTLLAHIDH